MNKIFSSICSLLIIFTMAFTSFAISPRASKSAVIVNTAQRVSITSGAEIQNKNLVRLANTNQQADFHIGNKAMKNTFKPDFVTLEFLADTPYKGEIRKIGDRFDVDGSYAKNFIAQNRAVAIETENDSGGAIITTIDDLKEKFSKLTVAQMAKERKDYLVASAYNLGIATVPDGLKNKNIAQLIYDHVHGRSE